MISKVHFNCVEQIIDKLDFCEKSLRGYETGAELKDKQPLMMSMNDTDDYCVIDRQSNTLFSDDNLQLIFTQLVDISNEAMHAVVLFVNCAAESFSFPFKIRPVYETSKYQTRSDSFSETSSVDSRKSTFYEAERTEIIQAEEKVFNS